jgi:equilibrative nucleoside transporter 1/2/3
MAWPCHQGGSFASSSFLPPRYNQAIMSGQAASGVASSVVAVVSTAMNGGAVDVDHDRQRDDTVADADADATARGYFFVSAALVFACFAGCAFLERTPFYRHRAAIAAERERAAAFREGEEGDEEDTVTAPLLRDGGGGGSEAREDEDDAPPARRGRGLGLTFAVTLVVFPSVTSSVCSASNPATAPPCVARPPGRASRLRGDLFAPTMFLLANACDFFGRSAAGAAASKPPPRGWTLLLLSIARVALIPPLLMCNVVVEGSWGVRRALAGSDAWPLALVAATSFTNGLLGSVCVMYGPSFVASGKRGEEGAKLSLAVIGGLATGSVLSFALTAWLQS